MAQQIPQHVPLIRILPRMMSTLCHALRPNFWWNSIHQPRCTIAHAAERIKRRDGTWSSSSSSNAARAAAARRCSSPSSSSSTNYVLCEIAVRAPAARRYSSSLSSDSESSLLISHGIAATVKAPRSHLLHPWTLLLTQVGRFARARPDIGRDSSTFIF
jgi:hypothetical protein